MTKHQTLAFIKYSNWINDINNEISNFDIKHDMFKFLAKFPGMFKQPDYITDTDYFESILGKFVFINSNDDVFTHIVFDGNNNFKLWVYIYRWYIPTPMYKEFSINKWISIDDVDMYLNYFCKLLNND